MHCTVSEPIGVWDCYSPAQLQRDVLWWPFSRFLVLVGSPGTKAFSVAGWNYKEGTVTLLVAGECEGEALVVTYEVYADELTHQEKQQLMSLIRFRYSGVGGTLIRRGVAIALRATVLT